MNGDSNDFDVLDRIARALEQVNGFGDHVCVFKNAGLVDDSVTVGSVTVGVGRSGTGPVVVQACSCGKVRQVR